MSNTKYLIFLLISIFISEISAQRVITAKVLDFENNMPIQDVSVQIKNTKRGIYTDVKGVFSLNEVSKNAVIVLSKIGYSSYSITANTIDRVIYLSPKISALEEVTIRSFSSSQLRKVISDQVYYSQKDIEKLPFILGEKDVIKLIQYTPGVQQASEGQSGLLVRGGNGSMNLTLLDNMYLHNTAHLGGLFSAINSDFVQSLEFSKSGFDASYGGRLSSVTDIKTLNASDSTSFKGSIGLLAAKLTGNIKINDNNSLLVSGRRTYLEVLKPFFGDDTSIFGKDKNYFLHDFLVKHSFTLSEKDNFETKIYLTKDNFRDQTKGRDRKLKWGNFLLGTTYNHQFSPSLSSKTTLSNSFYEFSLGNNDFPFSYNGNSTFNVFGLSQQFLWNKPSYLLKIGAAYNNNKVLPKRVQANVDNTPLEILNQETFDYNDISFFGDIEFPVLQKLKAKAGLRFTTFLTKPNALVDREAFFSIEPRVNLKYQFADDQAFKFSYQRLSQFIHQASVSSFSLPADFFLVSTKDIKPQVVNQFSFGYVFEENGLQLNTALFFKNVSNYTEFKNGAINNLFSNNTYEDIVVGQFKAYGFEASINKKINKFTAQGAITLSRAIAQFDEINQGNDFPLTFDRPVNINTIVHYTLNDRIELGALFLFSSGQNYTRPRDIRVINERPILNFEAKNASRFPNYHRLDLSCTYAFKKKGTWNSKLNLTLYNAYNNDNPFQIYFTTYENLDDGSIKIMENKDNLFPFLPTLNWIFAF